MKKKKLKSYNQAGTVLQNMVPLNPWQVLNPNSAEVMAQIYAPVQNAQQVQTDPVQNPFLGSQSNAPQLQVSESRFALPGQGVNFGYVAGSQALQSLISGIATRNPNSRQNAAKRFNEEQFNPLNYLPRNPNTSTQDLYGMEEGGEVDDEEWDFLFEEGMAVSPSKDVIADPKSKRQMRIDAAGVAQQQAAQEQQNEFAFLNSLMYGKPDAIVPSSTYNINGDQAEVAATVKDRLIASGMAPHIAAGFIGNFAAESSLNPSINNSIGAFGLGQWLGDRKDNLMNFAKKAGKSASDPTVQADFIVWELSNTEQKNRGKILNSKDEREAALNIMNYYERPSEKEKAGSAGKRVAAAVSAAQFAEGGEYDLDETEVERLKKLGYKVEIL